MQQPSEAEIREAITIVKFFVPVGIRDRVILTLEKALKEIENEN